MSELSNSPQNIGGILDSGIKLFKHSIKPVAGLAFIAGLVANLPAIFVANFMPDFQGSEQVPTDTAGVFASVAGLMIVSIVFSLAAYNAVIARIDALARNEEMSVSQALLKGLRRTPASLGAMLGYFLVVMIGFVLFVIPGIILSVYLYSTLFLVVIENAGPLEALNRSYQITKGSWWRVATVMTIALIIVIVLVLLFSLLTGAFYFAGGVEAGMAEMATPPLWIELLLTPLTNAISFMFTIAIGYTVISDLKLRHEGQDLQARAEALGD